jgi:hypothetical protein
VRPIKPSEMHLFKVLIDCRFSKVRQEYNNSLGFITIKFVMAADKKLALQLAIEKTYSQMLLKGVPKEIMMTSTLSDEEIEEIEEDQIDVYSENSFIYYQSNE